MLTNKKAAGSKLPKNA
jgi:hypothetical protein